MAYIDDVIIYSDSWSDHLQRIRKFFDRLSKAKLTVNLAKTEFCHATVTFLGHLVGQGQVKPLEAKVNAISEFPVPKCKRQLMRFLGMAGYYRKFCKNFSGIAEPLKCNSSPDIHVFLYLFSDCLCIIIHFSVYPTTIRARVLCLFAQVCKRKNPISEPRLVLAVILVT